MVVVSMTFHQSAKESSRSKPQALDRRDLGLRRVVGTTTVHGIPSRRACHASPWAMFPALAV
jgi:hypothetical protein